MVQLILLGWIRCVERGEFIAPIYSCDKEVRLTLHIRGHGGFSLTPTYGRPKRDIYRTEVHIQESLSPLHGSEGSSDNVLVTFPVVYVTQAFTQIMQGDSRAVKDLQLPHK